jgi:hypothetical protein
MKVTQLNKELNYVYDISLDGTFVNALGVNVLHNTDGMNFKQPDVFRYTEENPYVSTGMNRNTVKDKKYVGAYGDLAEFNDLFMRHKNGLDIDEFVPSSCYIARKNYIDLLDINSQKVKLVGNTIKSKKMPIYIEKFVDDTVRDLLNDRGKIWLDKYYDKIDEIYNLRIPLKDIATVGKIKMGLDEYKKNCKEKTKAGTKKSRQAWYELAIKHNLDVHMGDSIYYINTGTKKGDSDVKRVTHFMKKDMFGEIVNVTKEITKEYNKLKKLAKQGDESAQLQLGINTENTKAMNISDFVSKYHKECYEEDEIIFNCILLPNNIVEDEEPHYCDEDFEYNVDKYITMFNNRIKPQLVCFDKNIRIKKVTNKKGELVEENNIIIDNPKDRKYFTEEECKLVSGQPYKPSDQDTYEQLMTMEDKEIRFWISVNKRPIYEKECGMDWDAIKQEYLDRQEKLKQEGIKDEVELYRKIINSLTNDDIELLTEEGEIPNEILKICDFNPNNGSFISKTWNIKIGEIWEILDKKYDEVAEFINDLVSDAKIDVSNV